MENWQQLTLEIDFDIIEENIERENNGSTL